MAGEVITAGAEPICKVSVSLLDASGQVIARDTTGEGGSFQFTGLELGARYGLKLVHLQPTATGLTVRDMVQLSKYILNVIKLTPLQEMLVDLNDSRAITVLDLIMLRKLILEVVPAESNIWLFVDAQLQPAGLYYTLDEATTTVTILGAKRGDLDFSAPGCE